MASPQLFQILTPDGLSSETFVVPLDQPASIKKDCVLVIHDRSGKTFTVHRTRLFPVGSTTVAKKHRHACLKCGRVAGVVQDEVTCPEHGGVACGMIEAARSTPTMNALATAPMPGD
jgi:hypothetical protein